MKRPIAVMAAASFVSLTAASMYGRDAALRLAIICTALAAFALIVLIFTAAATRVNSISNNGFIQAFVCRVPVFLCIFITAAVSLFLYCKAWNKEVEPYLYLDGKEAVIRGQVLDYPDEQYGRFYYQIRVVRAQNKDFSIKTENLKLRLSSPFSIACEPGEYVELSARLYRFDENGLYSTQNSRLADGTSLGAYISGNSVRVIPSTLHSISSGFAKLRNFMASGFHMLLPEKEASLICLMLLGDENDTTDDFKSNFQRLGISHLLVISALHMTAIEGFLIFAIDRLPLGRVAKNMLTLSVLFCFLTVIGFPYPAVRSAIMCAVILLSHCFGRQADSLNSLGIAVLIICLADPFAAGDVGFTMSVCSSLGIIVLASPLQGALLRRLPQNRIFRRIFTPIAASLSVSLAVTLFNFPVMLMVFGGTSLAAAFANLVFIPVSVLLLYTAFAAAFLSLIPWVSVLAKPVIFFAGLLAKSVLWAADIFSQIKGIYLAFEGTTVLLVFAGCLLFLLLGYRLGKAKLIRRAAAISAAVLFLFGAGYEIVSERGSVEVIISGEEEANVLLIKDGEAAVLSLGGYRTDAAVYAFSDNNVHSVDTIFLPLQSADAVRALSSVTNTFGASRVLLPEDAHTDITIREESTGVPVGYVACGESFEALDGVAARLSKDGGSLSFSANGVSFTVETGESSGGASQVLITNQEASAVNSAFTVLTSDDIMDGTKRSNIWDSAKMNSYVFPTQAQDILLKVSKDGKFTVRRVS